MPTITATTYDDTFGVVSVTKRTSRPYTYAVIRVSDTGDASASFHLTRDAADKAAGRPSPGVTRHVVPVVMTLQRITNSHDDPLFAPMVRQLNRGAMVQWINDDLMNRAGCDVRKSVVLYDAERHFVIALPASLSVEDFLARADGVAAEFARLGITYWSRGVV